MTLIDTAGTPLADPYQYPAADQELTEADHCVVLLSQWDTYQEQFGKTATGVWVTGDQDPADLLALLNRTRVVVIEFPKSRDGRGFTLARVLRERHRYDGDIRAAGPLLPDQFSMLIQCGYTSVLAEAAIPLVRWKEAAMALDQSKARPRTLLDRLSQNR
ncbi:MULTISPECIES: DUF934 domain-containing protein [Pseudomonas]